MGIGNRRDPATGLGRSDSLPLMGIGNQPIPAPGTPTLSFLLITPHGDREPAQALRYRAETDDSLPLMGIGNQMASAVSPRDRCTHYPSWGSGTRRDRPRTLPRPAHYPSWGSGTRWRSLRTTTGRSLITPHGDREHGRESASLSSAKPSLPLMGIGNAILGSLNRCWSWTHYPSWGSGTVDAPAGGMNEHMLITPHGDRELG